MNDIAIKRKLSELSRVMRSVPPSGTKGTAAEGIYRSDIPVEAQSMDDLVDGLRLQIKYLTFDLEATRRENRYLRQMLDNRHDPRRDDSDGDQGSSS